MKILKTGKSTENKWLWVLSHIWDIYSNHPSPRLRKLCGSGGRKNIRVEGWGSVLWSLPSGCKSHKLTIGLNNCTWILRDLVSQNSNMDWRKTHRASPLDEKPLAADHCKRRESYFSLDVWSLVGCPCFIDWSHIYVHAGRTNWTQWGIN